MPRGTYFFFDFDDLLSPVDGELGAGLSDLSGLAVEGVSDEGAPSFFEGVSEDSDLAESAPFL